MNREPFVAVKEKINKVIEDIGGDFLPASIKDYPPMEIEPVDYDQLIDEGNFIGEENSKCHNFELAKTLRIDVPQDQNLMLELKYFLDGTFSTYYWGDFEIGNSLFPVVLGETVVSIVKRENKKFHKASVSRKVNIILPPTELSEISSLKENLSTQLREYEWINVTAIEENLSIKDMRTDVKTSMLSKVRAILHEEERDEALKIQRLDGEVLVIDGDLRKQIFEGMNNVIGLAKSFSQKPVIITEDGYQRLPGLLRNLRVGQRTCVLTQESAPQYKFWYLRLQSPENCDNYLQGIVKIEVNQKALKKPTQEFIDFVNQISLLILKERLPSSYPIRRWASHIYPIYIAEKMAKVNLTPTLAFRQLFNLKLN